MDVDEGPVDMEVVSDLDEEEAELAPEAQFGENYSETDSLSSVNNLDDL